MFFLTTSAQISDEFSHLTHELFQPSETHYDKVNYSVDFILFINV